MQNRSLQSVKWLAGLLLSTGPFLVSPIVARAQVSAGEIVGTVTDPSGAVLPGVQIEATHLATNQKFSTTVTAIGNYLLSAIPVGDYRVLAQQTGFKASVTETSVFTGRTTTVNIQMVLGALSDQVTVKADTAPLLQTTSAEVSTVLERNVIMDLPVMLNDTSANASGRRQIEQFEFLTPGVTGSPFSKSFNGSPDLSQEAIVDGVPIGNGGGTPGFIAQWTPPYESVQEFKVSSSLYPASEGRGFGITNFTMKSGTNEFHGDAFYIVNNDKFNARGFFAAERPAIRQNNFGFTIGGPIKKNKTFFFGSFERYILRTGAASRGLVTLPSIPFRSGDFSQLTDPSTGQLIPIYDPATTRDDGAGGFTRDPFPGNKIPSARFSVIAQRVIGLLPTPDYPGIVNNWIDRSESPLFDRVWSLKIDHNFNDKHRVNFSIWDPYSPINPHGPLGRGQLLDSGDWPNLSNGRCLRFNYEWTPKPNLINHFAFGWSLTGGPRLADVHKGSKILQVPGVDPNAPGFTSFNIPGMPEFGDSDQQPSIPQANYSTIWNDSVTWVHGRHQVKFGGDARMDSGTNTDSTTGGGASGSFYFSNLETSLPDSANSGNLGNGFASFLLGQADSAQRLAGIVSRTFSNPYMALFIDDKIQVTPKLVITPGVRYEVAWPYREIHGRMSALDLHLANAGAGGLPGAYVYGASKILPRLDLREWGPRLGIAYQWNNKTVIRAGYAWIYAPTNGAGQASYQTGGYNLFAGYSVINSFASTNGGVTPGTLVDKGFPAFTGTLPVIDPTIANGAFADYLNGGGGKQSSTQNWQLSVQRDVGWNTVVEAAYVANKASHLPAGLENLNQVPIKYLGLGSLLSQDISSAAAQAAGIKSPYPGFSGSVNQALLPFPQFLGITEQIEPLGNSSYNSMQMKVQKRTSNGLAFLVSYTLSKTLTDTSLSGFATFNSAALDTANRRLERSLAGNDQTHNVVMSWVYEVPLGKNARGPVAKLAKGWIVGGIASYRSGTPIGIGGGPDLLIFNGGNRPNRVPGVPERASFKGSFDPAADLYLNINAFSQPAPFTIGNVSRVEPSLRTFPALNENLSAIKRTYVPKISEVFNVEFKAEFFNIFNRTQFGYPNANINDPTSFGVVGYQANLPRSIQFSLRVNF